MRGATNNLAEGRCPNQIPNNSKGVICPNLVNYWIIGVASTRQQIDPQSESWLRRKYFGRNIWLQKKWLKMFENAHEIQLSDESSA